MTIDTLNKIHSLLSKNPSRSYSREEILNLLSTGKDDREIEKVLAELEVISLKAGSSKIHSTCMGGTVYFKWNA